MNKPAPTRIAILGLGNLLMQDDGVGVHIIRKMMQDPPVDTDLYEIGTSVLGSLDILENYAQIIAIDAVCADGPPGSVYYFDGGDALVPDGHSLHDLGLPAAIQMLDPERRPRVLIVGIQPAQIDLGLELSSKLKKALPQIVQCIHSRVHYFTHQNQSLSH